MWLVVASYTQYVSLVGMEGMARLKMVLDERLINFEWKQVVSHLIHKFQIIVWNMILSNWIKWLFDHQYFYKESVNIFDFFHGDSTNEQKLLSVLLSVGCGRDGKPCPNLARFVRGVSGWYELFRQVKIVQNESLVN